MKWKKWDGTGRERRFLDYQNDEIYYYREYTPWEGYSHSETNNLVTNFKMGPNPKNRSRLKYRKQAINIFATELRTFLEKVLEDIWLTWIPPSESPDDPKYDDRVKRAVEIACRSLKKLHPVEVIYNSETRPKLHHGAVREPNILEGNYVSTEANLNRYPVIALVDDILTQGTNFRAASNFIKKKYPEIGIVGIFWAITVDPLSFEIL